MADILQIDMQGSFDASQRSNLEALCNQAYIDVHERLGIAPPRQLTLQFCATNADYLNYLGFSPSETVAIARAEQREIVFNGPAWWSASAGERQTIMTHEMAHLALGINLAGDLPAWHEEGLAMLAANEVDRRGGGTLLMLAGSLGTLIPLSKLERHLLFGGETQQLAYAQALSVTRYLIERQMPDLSPFEALRAWIAYLADPQRGAGRIERLWDASFRDALFIQWRRSRKTIWNWIAALTSVSVIWAFVSGLFLLAWWRKRRFAQQKMERFTEEEALDEALGLGPTPWEYEAEETMGEGDDDYEERPV